MHPSLSFKERGRGEFGHEKANERNESPCGPPFEKKGGQQTRRMGATGICALRLYLHG